MPLPRWRIAGSLAVLCCAAPLAAQYEPTSAWDATVRELRSATTAQRDGSHHARLVALRGLGDPALAPFFEALLEGNHWSIQVDGLLGLAEVSSPRAARIDLLERLDGEENRSSAVRAALLLRLLDGKTIETLLGWDDLSAANRILLAAESMRMGGNPVGETLLRRLAESRNEEVAGLGAFLLQQAFGDGSAADQFAAKVEAMSADRRDVLLGILAALYTRYEVRPGIEFLVRRLERPDAATTSPEAELAMLAAILPNDADAGYRIWRNAVATETSTAQVLRLAALLLTSDTPLPPAAGEPLRSSTVGDPDLKARYADAIEALAADADPAKAIEALVATRHRPTVAAALEASRRLSSADRPRVLAAVMDLVSRENRGNLPPGISDLAIEACSRLVTDDPAGLERRLLEAEQDQALQELILYGLFTAGTPEAAAIAAKVRGKASRTGDSLALLLVARHANSLPEADLKQLALIVAGGGRVEDPLETQAAWLYAKLAGRGPEAIAAALAPPAAKP
jgi:nitroreductase